jgi:hypothetical protein
MSLILGVSALLLSLAPAPLVHCIAVGYGVVLVALWVQAALMRRRAALVVKQASSQPWYAGFQSAEDQRQRNIADITSADLGPAPADFDLPSDPFGSDLP